MSAAASPVPSASPLRDMWLAVKESGFRTSFTLEASKPRGRGVAAFPISFDPESGLSALGAQDSLLRQDSLVFRNGDEIHDVLSLCSTLNRLTTFSPADYGLVPFKMPESFSPWRSFEDSPISFLADSMNFLCGIDVEDVLSDGVIRLIPEELRKAGYGWCEGDPSELQFGALALVPVVSLQHHDPDEVWPDEEGWVLQQVGLQEVVPLSMARWNDTENLERLVLQVKTMTADSALSLRALQSDWYREDIRVGRVRFEQARVRPHAEREWDKSMELRPVLVGRAVKAASEEFLDQMNSTRSKPVRWSLWDTKILAAHLFHDRGRASDARSGVAARQLWSAYPTSQRMIEEFASILQRHLDERDLGTAIVRASLHDDNAIFVVRNIDFFNKYAPLFGVTD